MRCLGSWATQLPSPVVPWRWLLCMGRRCLFRGRGLSLLLLLLLLLLLPLLGLLCFLFRRCICELSLLLLLGLS